MKFNKEEITNSKYIELLKKYWIPIAAAMVAILVAVSIHGIYREEVLNIDPDVEYEQGDGLYLSAGNIDTLNPIVSQSKDTYYLSKLIYNSLFDYTDQFNVEPELVDSYTTDTEKGKITITLKPNVKWHDGKQVTAKDVKFTINAIKSYGSKGIYYEKVSKIRSVTTKGDYEVTITFNKNNDGSLDDLIFPIISSSTHSSVNRFIKDTEDYKPVGTGQYTFVEYDYLNELHLTPNKNYIGSVAQQDIYVQILPDKSLSSRMLETYSVTCYVTEESNRRAVAADKNYKMYDVISNDVEFMVFNDVKAPFDSKEVRQAAAYAIDTKKVLQDGYMEDGVLSNNIYYPGFLGVAENSRLYSIDMDKSKEMLKEAEYEDRDLNGTLEDSEGNVVSLSILVNNNNSNRVAAAKQIAKDLQNVGFTVSINSVPWDEYLDKIEEKEYDILLVGYEMNPNYDLREFFDGKNPWGYQNDTMLEKASELERLHTSEEYTQIYSELKDLMMDELPYYTLCYRNMGLIGVEYFEAAKLPTFDDIYRNCNTWSWKTVKVAEE